MRTHALLVSLLLLPSLVYGLCVASTEASDGPAGDTTTATEYDLFVEALEAKDYKTAAAILESMIAQRPDWASGHVVLGKCNFLLGRHEAGDRSLSRAKQLAPDTDLFKIYHELGVKLQSSEQYERSVPALERARDHAPVQKRSSVTLRLATSYLGAGQPEKAVSELRAYDKRYGADLGSTYHLALAWQQQGDYARALESLRKASGMDGREITRATTLQYMAEWSWYWAKHPDNETDRTRLLAQAAQDARPWFEADPGNAAALTHYGRVLLEAGLAEEASRRFEPVARENPKNCTVRLVLARIYRARGENEGWETWAAEAVTCDATVAGSHVELAAARIDRARSECTSLEQARESRARIEKAIESLERALEIDPQVGSGAHTTLADARTALGHLETIEADFVAADESYQDALARARLDEIRKRCQAIYWNRTTGTQRLSAEDGTWFREHDCQQQIARGD